MYQEVLLPVRGLVCVRERVSECVYVYIRRFYCLYGDSMNVAARMSANAKESGVCVSPQIAAHLASASASASALASLPHLSSFPSVWSDCASSAAKTASPAGHTATDVPSEELKWASMRALETVSDAGFLETLKTPLGPSLRDTRSDSCACATPRLSVVPRGCLDSSHLLSSVLISSLIILCREAVRLCSSHLLSSNLSKFLFGSRCVARIASHVL